MAEINLSITIPDDNSVDVLEALLAVCPNTGGGTDEEWLTSRVCGRIQKVYEKGKKKIRDDNATVISDIFTAQVK